MKTKVDPKYNKLEVNYHPGFMVEIISKTITETTTTGDVAQKAIQMEHELLARGIPEEEVQRAVIAYFSEAEPPYAMPWPGPVTGMDLAGTINNNLVVDTGEPTTNFAGLPKNVEPYPTPNISPYGIGSSSEPYQSFFTPDPNSLGSLSNVYDVLSPPYPGDNTNWSATASQLNSEPSMHGEYGFNVAKSIPEWRYPIEDSQVYPTSVSPDIIFLPSGTNPLTEAKKTDKQKKIRNLLLKWGLLLGGLAGINKILDGKDPEKPLDLYAKYTATLDGKTCPECRDANGKIFNFIELHNRPVLPSENLGYTTRHPNCRCKWDVQSDYKGRVDSLNRKEESEIHKIESHISDAAKNGTLHKVKKDGALSKKTTKKNPIKEECSCNQQHLPTIHLELPIVKLFPITTRRKKTLQESISNLRSEFDWLTEEYISKAQELVYDSGGVLYLVRAAGETITDHTGEGEPYRRKLSADELNSMTRTAIGKSMDINHQPEFEVDASILDAEFDKSRKEIQMLVIVRDNAINNAIDDKKIEAVSINGGMPRSETIEPCDHDCTSNNCELCLVPKGVVLGELDGIGMTFVVTDPNGLYWNGHHVPSAEPGIKTTKIEKL